MANLTTIPAIDWFETTLASSWNGAVWSVSVNDVPSGTIESWETSYIVVNPGKSNMQVAQIDWWDSWTKTFNVTNITVEKGNWVNYSSQTHAANSVVRFSNNYVFWKDIRTAVNSKAGTDTSNTWSWTQTFDKVVATGYIKDAVYIDATTRDTAIPSPSNWMRIYNTALWLFQKYQAWAWTDDTGWASTPNASTTVAGKVEKATPTEVTAWTSTGGTGAELFVWPAELKTVTDSITVPDASETVKWKVELATLSETIVWIDTTRAVTPAWVAWAIANIEWYDEIIRVIPYTTWAAWVVYWWTMTATSSITLNSMLWRFTFAANAASNREFYTELPIKSITSWLATQLQWNAISKIEFEWYISWNDSFSVWFATSTSTAFVNYLSTQRKVLLTKTFNNTYVNINTSDWTTQSSWSNVNMPWTHALYNKYNLIYDVTNGNVKIYMNGVLWDTKTTNLPTWANDLYFWFWLQTSWSSMWLSNCKVKIKYV